MLCCSWKPNCLYVFSLISSSDIAQMHKQAQLFLYKYYPSCCHDVCIWVIFFASFILFLDFLSDFMLEVFCHCSLDFCVLHLPKWRWKRSWHNTTLNQLLLLKKGTIHVFRTNKILKPFQVPIFIACMSKQNSVDVFQALLP